MSSSARSTSAVGEPSAAEWHARDSGSVIDDSIPGVLGAAAAEAGDTAALLWPAPEGVGRLTYAELSASAHRVAGALAAVTRPLDRVAVWSRNSVEWVLLEYACAIAGLVLVPYNPAWTDAEAGHATQLAEPALIFAGPDSLGRPLAERAAVLSGGPPVQELGSLLAWAGQGQEAVARTVHAGDPFLIQFTSGTTGRAKGVVLSHRAGLNAGYLRARHDVIRRGDVWLNPVPYHHVAGTCSVILGALTTRGGFVVTERYDRDLACALLRDGVAARLGGVPVMIEGILDSLAASAAPVRLDSIAVGGAPVSQELVKRAAGQTGARVIIGYGQSECPIITSTDPDTDPALIERTVGRPLEGTDLRIQDPESGALLARGQIGEITVRSPAMMDGYYNAPGQTAEAMTPDGFLRTGDLGSMDADGFITFHGRARDVIIRGGENIYPAEVEQALSGHPAVQEVVVTGVDDTRWGEEVGAVVQLAAAATVTADELDAYARGQVAHFKVPRHWLLADGFPLTASGKIRRNVVRDDLNAAVLAGQALRAGKGRA